MRDRASRPDGRTAHRRRAPGLRREEVAVEAGISVTWYTWLEQGRSVRVSPQTLDGIARALRLTPTERDHLRTLAAAASPDHVTRITPIASTTLTTLVNALSPHAAYTINGRWDVLHANDAARDLLGDFGATPGTTDNVLRRLFLDDDWRRRFSDWESVASSAVAQFRASTGGYLGGSEFDSFVTALSDECSDFAALWTRHQLAPSASWEKSIVHPERGPLRLLYATLQPANEATDVRIVLYSQVA